MSALALFALGVAVSTITFTALALLVAGAILDGRDERARRAEETAPAATPVPLQRAAAVIPLPTKGEAA
jgi:hypothetical protein